MREAIEHIQDQLGIHGAPLHHRTANEPAHRSPLILAQSRMRRHRLLRDLATIHHHWLVDGAYERWLLMSKSSCLSSVDPSTARLAVTHVVRTAIGQKLSSTAVACLATQLVETIFLSRAHTNMTIHQVCAALIADFPFHICPGVPLTESKPLHGILIPSGVALKSMSCELQSSRTILLHCAFSPIPLSHESSSISFRSDSSSRTLEWLELNERWATRWSKRLSKDGIRFILSTCPVSESTLAILQAIGITVAHCLDEFDTRRVAKYANLTPITNIDLYEDDPLPIGTLAAVTQIVVGGQTLLHVEFDRTLSDATRPATDRSELIRGHTLLLCGASEGMCKQYQGILTRCLKLVQEWSQASQQYYQQQQQQQRPHTVSDPIQPSSTHPLYIIGGGGSVELSLIFFLSSHSRLHPSAPSPPPSSASSASSTFSSMVHPLLPPTPISSVAWRVLEKAFENVLTHLLHNGATRDVGHSITGTTSDRLKRVEWVKMMPHMVRQHDERQPETQEERQMKRQYGCSLFARTCVILFFPAFS